MRTKIIALTLILGGCSSIPFFGKPSEIGRAAMDVGPPAASVTVRPTIQDTAPAEFKYIPTNKSQTDRDDLFRLIDATNEAYEVLGFEKPYPLIRIVKPTHPRLGSRSALATATLNEDGKEVVYFNRYWVASGKPMRGVVIHEYAHFQTWRRFGHAVHPHGREFWGICTQATARKNCTTYKR